MIQGQVSYYLIPLFITFFIRWAAKSHRDISLKNNVFYISQDDNGQENSYERDDMNTKEGVYGISQYLQSCLNIPIHQNLNHYATINTLKYLYHHLRCGILCMIRNNKLVIFCPFVNSTYRNNWLQLNQKLITQDKLDDYYDEKKNFYRAENYLSDISEWWANGNIICTEHCSPKEMTTQWWGDHFLLQLKDMIVETCNQREVSGCNWMSHAIRYNGVKV